MNVRFAIQGKVGGNWKALAPIQGNPASRTVGTMLTPTYGAAFVFWAWSNWCGGGDQFRAYARVNGKTVVGSISAQGATCEDSSAPSRLTPNFGHS